MISTSEPGSQLYTRRFFALFAALLAYMSGHSILVHLAKYVVSIGGDIASVSWVFGLGMIGSLVTRPFIGRWTDRAGCRPVLLVATLGAALTILCFQWVRDLAGIGALRVLLQLCQAAFLTTAAVFAARIAPPGRSAECLAMIGMGGLAGVTIGPTLGDVIFRAGLPDDRIYAVFFGTGAAMMMISAVLVVIARPPASLAKTTEPMPSFIHLLVHYWPGAVVVIAICMALAQTIPFLFIERFVEDRGLHGVTLFFLAYSPTAMVLRVVARRLPARIGRRRTLLLGMSCYTVGIVLLIFVRSEIELLVPAVVMGAGHCFSYPFLVDLATERMPPEHKGVAVSIILGVVDMGFLVGFIVEGELIRRYGFAVTLAMLATVCGVGGATFAWAQRKVLRA